MGANSTVCNFMWLADACANNLCGDLHNAKILALLVPVAWHFADISKVHMLGLFAIENQVDDIGRKQRDFHHPRNIRARQACFVGDDIVVEGWVR